jgi:hypothetical protein
MYSFIKIFMNYDETIKYFSHHRFNKLVNSVIIDNDNVYHYHKLEILDHLYKKNLDDVKSYLYNNFPDIKFIFCNKNSFNYEKMLLSLDRIYIIYNNIGLITDIIGIDIRPKYQYVAN